MSCGQPSLKSEQEALAVLAGSTFEFMVDGLSYWPVPCKPCNGFHIIVLPVRTGWYERPKL